jgi:hypothetical protein
MILVFIPLYPLFAQDPSFTPDGKYKLTLTYGISAVNPTEINEHILTSNTVFTSMTKQIKSIAEMSAAFSIRPSQDNKIVLLRGGYISLERSYQLSIPETRDTISTTGYTTGTIKETYTAYPLSLGVGLTSSTNDSQIQLEFIFGLGYIEEEGSYTSASGRKTNYLRTLFSPAYGLRIAGQTTVRLAERIGLTLELGYRWLSFRDFEDEATGQPSNIIFSYSGINGAIGLSIIF